MAKVTAQLNYSRMAPRKVRSVAGVLKGMDIQNARRQLEYTSRRPAIALLKLLNSAVANAKNNFSMVEENLFIENVLVNEGTKLKRYKPKGFGRASPIQKKTSHIKIILEEKKPGLKMQPKPKDEKTVSTQDSENKSSETLKTAEPEKDILTTKRKPEIKKEIKKGLFKEVKNIGKKIFRRKKI